MNAFRAARPNCDGSEEVQTLIQKEKLNKSFDEKRVNGSERKGHDVFFLKGLCEEEVGRLCSTVQN